VIVGSPSNPTGAVLSAARLGALAEQAALCGAWVLLDEIYAPLFEGAFAPCPASAGERVLLVGGVSKAFALTGLRVGWLVAPPEVVERLLPVHQHLVTCAPRPAQQAALAALASGDETPAGARALYAALRRRALAGLGAVGGLRVDDPHGGYYLWVDVRERLGLATRAFAIDAARAGSVLVVPGDAFGPAGAGYLRLSVAAGERTVDEGIARLALALAGSVS
jgi:aspartate/methionine/tyrosine aminotransferase